MTVAYPKLSRCYRASLWLYPAELRRAYGRDMVDAFERGLETEWRRRGQWGILRAGFRAAGELITVALPGHLTSDWVLTAGLALVINSGILGLLVGVMMKQPIFNLPHH